MLIVAMPTTSSLPGITKEADEIKQNLRNFSKVETTAESVLQALSSYSVSQFTCHGLQAILPTVISCSLAVKETLTNFVSRIL